MEPDKQPEEFDSRYYYAMLVAVVLIWGVLTWLERPVM